MSPKSRKVKCMFYRLVMFTTTDLMERHLVHNNTAVKKQLLPG